ncbi:MAG: 2'-5' RNA ligase family protein [Bacteroidota bacterium]
MENLYFIAIIPPENIQNEITLLKHEVAKHFESSHALNSPPHITLHMPFKWKDKKLSALYQLMNEINTGFQPFKIELRDFDFFEPRVVFVDVVANKKLYLLQNEVVNACRKKLKLDHANYKNQAFHPHVTIGFRDLKKRLFPQVKRHFEGREIYFEFQPTVVNLLKHTGRQWEIVDLVEINK